MTENAKPDTEVEAAVKAVRSSVGENFRTVRNRVIAGVFVVLPVFITFAVIGWLYNVLYHYALGPIAFLLKRMYFSEGAADAINASMNDKSGYYLDILCAALAVVSLLAILFVAGMFAQSRFHRVFDWVLLKVPGIKTIYSAVSNVLNSVSGTQGVRDFKRVVLVEFPHPGMKAPAFVTNECIDQATNKTMQPTKRYCAFMFPPHLCPHRAICFWSQKRVSFHSIGICRKRCRLSSPAELECPTM